MKKQLENQSYQIPDIKKRKKQITILGIIKQILFYGFLIILAIIFTFPVLWMVVNSFKTQSQVYETINSLKTFLPYTWDVTKWFESYKNLFSTFENFGQSIVNSIVYAAITIAGVLFVNSLAGYALSRFVFPGHKLVVTIIILLLIIPVETSIVPMYVILKNMGLLAVDLRIVGYLIPGIVSPFYIFMFRSYFMGIPKELEEAAYIDGAGKLKTFLKIIIPVSLPVFATIAIFTFMGSWNEYIFAQLMFSSPSQQPLQVFLQLINNFNPKDISLVMASLTFSTIPIVIVYVFCQRYIIEGVAFTGLK
jgi:fructooligosaccharide transport system permease protein